MFLFIDMNSCIFLIDLMNRSDLDQLQKCTIGIGALFEALGIKGTHTFSKKIEIRPGTRVITLGINSACETTEFYR